MKSKGLRLITFLVLTSFPSIPAAFAADEPTRSDLSDIKNRLAVLEQQQKEILAKEDKILEELDRVRIWVHKR